MMTVDSPQALKVYYDKDIDRSKLLSKKIAVIGFGSQGFGQSVNLKASGANVKIVLRQGSKTAEKVNANGMESITFEEAAEWADILLFLCPDVVQADVYTQYFEGKLRKGQALMFSHGFAIHFGYITPPADVDVFLVAGETKEIALGYAACVGGGRGGVIETTFKDETETDLFGEQAVLCGGAAALVKAGFEVLTEAGYPPEMAYFECLHELKLIVDLMYEGGLDDMRYSISDTARYGDVTRGPRVVDADTKARMKVILKEIQDGTFAREFTADVRAGMPQLKSLVEADSNHPIEVTGRKLRGMMSWLSESKNVQRDKN